MPFQKECLKKKAIKRERECFFVFLKMIQSYLWDLSDL